MESSILSATIISLLNIANAQLRPIKLSLIFFLLTGNDIYSQDVEFKKSSIRTIGIGSNIGKREIGVRYFIFGIDFKLKK